MRGRKTKLTEQEQLDLDIALALSEFYNERILV